MSVQSVLLKNDTAAAVYLGASEVWISEKRLTLCGYVCMSDCLKFMYMRAYMCFYSFLRIFEWFEQVNMYEWIVWMCITLHCAGLHSTYTECGLNVCAGMSVQ